VEPGVGQTRENRPRTTFRKRQMHISDGRGIMKTGEANMQMENGKGSPENGKKRVRKYDRKDEV
jgi:hypothetical protein